MHNQKTVKIHYFQEWIVSEKLIQYCMLTVNVHYECSELETLFYYVYKT